MEAVVADLADLADCERPVRLTFVHGREVWKEQQLVGSMAEAIALLESFNQDLLERCQVRATNTTVQWMWAAHETSLCIGAQCDRAVNANAGEIAICERCAVGSGLDGQTVRFGGAPAESASYGWSRENSITDTIDQLASYLPSKPVRLRLRVEGAQIIESRECVTQSVTKAITFLMVVRRLPGETSLAELLDQSNYFR